MMTKIDLNSEWQVRSECGTYQFTMQVPGSLFHVLEKQGVFGEEGVFWRENNRACLDIADREFIFTNSFQVSSEFLSQNTLFLEAQGLDTLSSIYVNGTLVGETNNMHRFWSFDVKPFLVEGQNQIEVRFGNAIAFVKREREVRQLFNVNFDGKMALPGWNVIRKSHCSFGWDWGPMIPDVGIWRPINISAYQSARLDSVLVVQEHHDETVFLAFTPEITKFENDEVELEVWIYPPDRKKALDPIIKQRLDLQGTTKIQIDKPKLWWPNGVGEQPLYSLEYHFTQGSKTQISQKRIGLRELRLDRTKDEWGESFQFECNGVAIFSRGANYIPEDVFLDRDEPYSRETLIQDCKAANFNCVRVWGGGVYPDTGFYDLCDEAGLIVWQDLMFACAIYDVNNNEFMDNVEAEIRDNLTRIRHHACLGLICGNNEMEWAFEEWDNFDPTDGEREEYLKQYQEVFPPLVKSLCPHIDYWASSPSSGGGFDDPNSPDRGDCHYWDVWHGGEDFSDFKNYYFRFMSEYGFVSLPDMKTVESFTLAEDRNLFSPVMDDHQRCHKGNEKILTYIAKYYRYPKDFVSLVYVSQLSQAEAIRHGVEHWRRNRGRCMGSTYWQLNDNWPVSSWSSVDYYGRWKALHYVAKRVYNNILVSCDADSENEKRVSLHISNESMSGVSGMLSWTLQSLSGELYDRGEVACCVDALHSQEIKKMDFSDALKTADPRHTYLSFCFTVDGEHYYGTYYFVPYKWLSLENPQLNVERVQQGDRSLLRVTAQKAALGVSIELSSEYYLLSDNYFDLNPGQTREIEILSEKNSGSEKELVLRSLFDSYV